MSEVKRIRPQAGDAERRARDWADAIPDEDERPSPYEATYRDGSLKNECWNQEDR